MYQGLNSQIPGEEKWQSKRHYHFQHLLLIKYRDLLVTGKLELLGREKKGVGGRERVMRVKLDLGVWQVKNGVCLKKGDLMLPARLRGKI